MSSESSPGASAQVACACESCGAPLARPDAACPACEASLTAHVPDLTQGAHACPSCHARFDRAGSAAWPPDAAWYRPQMARPCCPHCHTFLTDLSQFTPWQNAGVFGVVVCAQLFVTPGWARAQVLGATLLLALGLKAWRLRQVRGKPRFVPWASR